MYKVNTIVTRHTPKNLRKFSMLQRGTNRMGSLRSNQHNLHNFDLDKAWQHRRMFKELDMGRQRRKISTEHILSLLVESGFIYSLLWLTQIIVYLDIPRTSPWFFVLESVQVAVHVLAGMYPTIIIVIVNFQRTIWEESSFTINSGPVVSKSLPWSAPKRLGPTDTINTQSEGDIPFQTIKRGRDPEVV
ncbi:hypothetical protein C8R45DRAFT_926813 [Mycena sanguinolenta]|nr:hypothetical protein C8R45DRAFT_926813 [Mycena sanguinolenta]